MRYKESIMNRLALNRKQRAGGMKPLAHKPREAARLLALGLTHNQVADQLDYHPRYIAHLTSDPRMKQHIAEVAELRDASAGDIRKDIAKGAATGLQMLLNILTPQTAEHAEADIKTKVRVAQDLLDREGSAPKVSRSVGTGATAVLHLTADDIDGLKARISGQPNAKGLDTGDGEVVLDLPKRRSKDGLIPDDLLAQEPG